MALGSQVVALFVLALPIACIAWTITHEEVFREPREYCAEKSQSCRSLAKRKFFYLFTCEYCFSHYVTIAFLLLTGYKLLYADWRGYLVGGFALVWVANLYMSLFGRLRLDIKREHVEIKQQQNEIESSEQRQNIEPDERLTGAAKAGSPMLSERKLKQVR